MNSDGISVRGDISYLLAVYRSPSTDHDLERYIDDLVHWLTVTEGRRRPNSSDYKTSVVVLSHVAFSQRYLSVLYRTGFVVPTRSP